MFIFPKGLFYIIQLAGLFPVSEDNSTLNGVVLRCRPLKVFYSVFILLSLSVSSVIRVWGILFENTSSSTFWLSLSSRTSVVIAGISTVSSFACCITSLLVAIFNVHRKITILEKMREIDYVIQKKEPLYNSRAVSYLVLLQMFVVIICSSNYNFNPLSLDTVGQVNKMVVTVALVEFMQLALGVRHRFRLINQRLVEFVTTSQMQSLWTVTLPSIETTTPHRPHHLLNIRGLNRAHWNLCLVVFDIGDIYGPQMIFTMIFLFAHLVFNPYHFFLLYNNKDEKSISLIISANWFLVYFVQLYVFVWPCSLAIREAKRTLAVVSQLMNRDLNKHLFQQLETFGNQLLDREVQFSACRFFTIHTPLVISIAGAVTTYMAIIIQFQATTGSKNGNSTTNLEDTITPPSVVGNFTVSDRI